jgi:hypothetical protein
MSESETWACLLPIAMFVQSTITLLFAEWFGDIEIKERCGAYQCFGWPLLVLAMPIVVPIALYRCWKKRKCKS